MALREILRIELPPSTSAALDRACDRTGMKQITMLSRLVEWFANQEPTVRCAIMGHFPPDVRVDITRLMLEQMVNAGAEEGEE